MIDFCKVLEDMYAWSKEVFGLYQRTEGYIEHIQKEIEEIRKDPDDPIEWIDVAILALDGACRTSKTPTEVAELFLYKVNLIKTRQYPDWRTLPLDVAVEHIRETPND